MARNKESKEPTYAQAIAELEEIMSKIESEDVDVDALSAQVKRAAILIKLCRDRLRSTGEEVKKIFSDMESPSSQDNSLEKDLGLL